MRIKGIITGVLFVVFLSFCAIPAMASDALVVLNTESISEMNKAIQTINNSGGKAIHIYPTHLIIGDIDKEKAGEMLKDQRVSGIYFDKVNLEIVRDYGKTEHYVAEAWNARFSKSILMQSQPGLKEIIASDPGPIYNDLISIESEKSKASLMAPWPGFEGATDTSRFMIGSTAVSVVLMESNGAIDPDTENWDSAREANVISEIQNALNWWTARANERGVSVSWVYDINYAVPTGYEPITRNSVTGTTCAPQNTDHFLWINDAMAYFGFGTCLNGVRNYVNNLRTQLDTNWAFAIFVVDSLNDADGRFADNYFAYSYINGPFLVMTYDNNGYTISNMDATAAHEIGHIFGAIDQYGSCACASQGGYLRIENQNCINTCALNIGSIMRGGVTPYTLNQMDKYGAAQIGWLDSDNDTRWDPLDKTGPDIEIISPLSQTYTSGTIGFNVSVLPEKAQVIKYSLDGNPNVTICATTINKATLVYDDCTSYNEILNLGEGIHTINVWANDSRGNIGQKSVTFEINFDASLQITVISPENKTYNQSDIMASVSLNKDGDWCGYSLNGAVNVSMTAATQRSFYSNINSLSDGNYNIIFSCNDTSGNITKSNTIYFSVNTSIPINHPPAFNFPLTNQQVNEDALFTYDIDCSDPDNDSIIYSDNSPLFNINPVTGVISDTPRESEVGTYEVTITCSANGQSVSSKFNYTINNLAPVIFPKIPDRVVDEGTSWSYNVDTTDNTDSLTWTDDTTLFNINPVTGVISDTPTSADIGTHTITITVIDRWGASDSDSFLYTINNASAPPSPCASVPSGTEGLWAFNEANGSSSASDSLGSNTFTWSGDGTFNFAPGRAGNAVVLSGNSYAVSNYNSNLDNVISFSVEGWVYPTGRTNVNHILRRRFSECVGGSQFLCSSWFVRTDNSGYLDFGVTKGDMLYKYTSEVGLPLNTWSHVAFVYDGTTGTMNIYKNGIKFAGTMNVYNNSELINSGANLKAPIGPINNGRSDEGLMLGSITSGWIGKIDELNYVNRAMTQSEIKSVFNAGAGGFCGIAPAPQSVINKESIEVTNQTENSIVIVWQTSANGTSIIALDTDSEMSNPTYISNDAFATSHKLELSGLMENTTYYYQITSCDSENLCDTSGILSFQTPYFDRPNDMVNWDYNSNTMTDGESSEMEDENKEVIDGTGTVHKKHKSINNNKDFVPLPPELTNVKESTPLDLDESIGASNFSNSQYLKLEFTKQSNTLAENKRILMFMLTIILAISYLSWIFYNRIIG